MATQATVVDPYRSTAKLTWCEGCKRWIANPWAHAGCVATPRNLLPRRLGRRRVKVEIVSVSQHTRRSMFTCVLKCGHTVTRSRYQIRRHSPSWAWCRECP